MSDYEEKSEGPCVHTLQYEVDRLKKTNAALLEALKAIIGPDPDKFGYTAAHNAMDDNIREQAIAAIALAEASNV